MYELPHGILPWAQKADKEAVYPIANRDYNPLEDKILDALVFPTVKA